MQVDIHRNFLAALRELTEPERDSIRRTIDILFSHGFTPGMRRHMVGAFLSLSPNMDLRVLASERGERIVLIHVDHHDKAYEWASRTTLLDTSYSACEILPMSKVSMLFDDLPKDFHLPIPVANLLKVKDENILLYAIESLSPEWQEWILSRYIDDDYTPPPMNSSLVFVADGSTELMDALQVDIPDWRIFLHPSQKMILQDNSFDAMAISGGPGTGKTSVILNRLLL